MPDGLRIFYTSFYCEILLLIPLGCIVVAASAKLFKCRNYLYLITAIVWYALYIIVSPFIPEFTLKSFVMSPGLFSPFPWLIYFFVSVYAYRSSNRNNLILSIILLVIYIGLD